MAHRTGFPCGSLLACLFLLHAPQALADEGMWTFDNPPTKLLAERYGFSPDPAWFDHLRLSSVRFMDGGSGSFVSAHGLVVTNHHVAAGQLQKMSTAERNYMATGFYARELAAEIQCPDLEVNVLVSMQDVSAQVLAAAAQGKTPALSVQARDAEKARIEKQCMDETKLRCDVVSLYQGGQYWLYRSKKYTDVRLVFAPERQAAFFGGDWDNFTYPRHDLDVAFFRVYDQDRPLASEHWLTTQPAGAKRDELVFITGHPGRTDRLNTVRQLEISRDLFYPLYLGYIERVLAGLAAYAKLGEEQERRALIFQFGYANAQKAYTGEHQGLKDPALLGSLRKAEQELRAKVAADPKLKKQFAEAWTQVERVYDKNAGELARRVYQSPFRSNLADKAITIVKYVTETAKPDAERLDGFHDSELEELRFKLFSPAPIYPDVEAVLLEASFDISSRKLPKSDPWVRLIASLGGPAQAAQQLCGMTRLLDPAVRRALIEGGAQAVEQSDDALIAFARKAVPILTANERWIKATLESVTMPAKEKIAKARLAVYGANAYPDATFTLRMTFGPVKGYPYNGTQAQYQTTLYGLYDRALGFDRQGDWNPPARFWERERRLDLATQVNFVCECDIIGGNSGSPVVNRAGELVGVVFDGNIESLSNRFGFDPIRSRAVAVSSDYVLEALDKLYDAGDLVDELTKK